jgi:hypothetical protein
LGSRGSWTGDLLVSSRREIGWDRTIQIGEKVVTAAHRQSTRMEAATRPLPQQVEADGAAAPTPTASAMGAHRGAVMHTADIGEHDCLLDECVREQCG